MPYINEIMTSFLSTARCSFVSRYICDHLHLKVKPELDNTVTTYCCQHGTYPCGQWGLTKWQCAIHLQRHKYYYYYFIFLKDTIASGFVLLWGIILRVKKRGSDFGLELLMRIDNFLKPENRTWWFCLWVLAQEWMHMQKYTNAHKEKPKIT